MSGHSFRLDNASGEQLRDNTFRNAGDFTAAGEEADRQTKFLQADTEGGIGSDEYGRVGSDTRHMVSDVDEGGRKAANDIDQSQKDALGNIARSARSI